MDELEELFDKIRLSVENYKSEIKRLSKDLYDKNGELSRTITLLDKERITSREFEIKLKKLDDLFKGVK